eukprot:TRINITY_DN6448_c0_g1_i1.p2 TRINITY_DN6448_c0_g1~~TRINITY_DN6448_c0_g1_i1.p2  ORF type:complete len:106 (-),score=23.22 TRINITY_DN6448_c0_g1_i1:69-386(-)
MRSHAAAPGSFQPAPAASSFGMFAGSSGWPGPRTDATVFDLNPAFGGVLAMADVRSSPSPPPPVTPAPAAAANYAHVAPSSFHTSAFSFPTIFQSAPVLQTRPYG